MVSTVSRYAGLLRDLLPPGRLWSRDRDGVLEGLLRGLAHELERIDAAAERLPEQLNPLFGRDFIAEWERVLGLPDECLPAPQGFAERQAQVLAILAARGGIRRSDMVAVAAAAGFTVSIEESASEFITVDDAEIDDEIGNEPQAFVWTIQAPPTTIQYATVDEAEIDDPLATWGNEALECAIRRVAPAHTFVRFTYDGLCVLVVLDPNGDPMTIELGANNGLVALDPNGMPLVVPTSNGELVALDPNGDPLIVELTCPE